MDTRTEYRNQERAAQDDRIWTGPTKKCQGCNALLYVSDPDLCERCDDHATCDALCWTPDGRTYRCMALATLCRDHGDWSVR